MEGFRIYHNACYANFRHLGHARDAWRLGGAQRRPAELRQRLDARSDVVRVGSLPTAVPDPKPKASAGCSAKPSRHVRARSTCRVHREGGWPAAGSRIASGRRILGSNNCPSGGQNQRD